MLSSTAQHSLVPGYLSQVGGQGCIPSAAGPATFPSLITLNDRSGLRSGVQKPLLSRSGQAFLLTSVKGRKRGQSVSTARAQLLTSSTSDANINVEDEGGRALFGEGNDSIQGSTYNGSSKGVNGSAHGTSNGSYRSEVNGHAGNVDENATTSLGTNGATSVATVNSGVRTVAEPAAPVLTSSNAAAIVTPAVSVVAPGAGSAAEESDEDTPWFKSTGSSQVAVAPGGRWNRFKAYSTIQRTMEIWSFAIVFAVKAWLINQRFAYRGGVTEEKKRSRRRSLAKWLKEGLLRLGPTFIKIGQQFSTRVDILAQEYVDELAQLQDQVPPFEAETAVAIVEEDLGRPVGEIFERFDRDPIAAASLGQVHRARLNGKEVAVKVQRPGLKALFDIDLKNLRVIAQNLQKIDPKSDGAKRDWVAIYDECAAVLYQEIDYLQEGKNADLFRSNFADKDYIKVPSIYWEQSTSQVLVMEYVPGIKINRIAALDRAGVDRKRIARYTVEAYLEQLLRHGFFHADPHPGNIAVDEKNGGRLIFYDFGMMGSISSNIREGLVEAFYGVYEKDPDKVLDAMVQMGVLVPTGDRTAVRRTAQFFLNSFEERLANQRKEKELEKAQGKKPLTKEEMQAKKKQRLAAIGEDLLSIGADQPFRFPATFTFVVRAFSVLDGIGKGLDPAFDISEIASPYAQELLRFREAGTAFVLKDLKRRWDRQAQAFRNLVLQGDRVEKLTNVITKLEQGELKLRVRTLESERAFKRATALQEGVGQGLVAATLLNIAIALQSAARSLPANAAYFGSAFFALQVLVTLFKVKKMDEKEKLITGTA